MQYVQSSAKLRTGYISVLKAACREVSTPYSQKCLRELNRTFVRLGNLDLDLRSYTDPVDMIKDRQLHGLITKYPGLPCEDDPADACLRTYYKFEEQCKDTNERLSSGRLPEPDVSAVMFTAKRKIAQILGDVPLPQDLKFTFGPGASRNVKRRTSAFHKIKAEPECTYSALVPSLRLLTSVPGLWTFWGGSDTELPKLKIVPGSRFGQVPKSAKTNRPIDIEPTLNGVLQRGYGSVIKDRLRRVGNCISSGQQRHSTLAREASVHKELATIDKSGASDSIASMLVFDLLPDDWFNALDAVRSKSHLINGKEEYLQKFSAMGNGFTFELETLIFMALARSCCSLQNIDPSLVSVYGDDVIIPQAAVDLYFKVCNWCGFTINKEKSFWGSDCFRESCGSDWFNGIDVRVAYMRHDVTPHYLTTLHNRMIELGIDHLLPDTVKKLGELVPERFRIFGPPSEHKYGYLHSWDHLETVRAIRVRPSLRDPKGHGVMPYAIYTTQFLGEFDVASNEDIVLKRSDEHLFRQELSMQRLATRGDFKLSTLTVLQNGKLQVGKYNYY